MTHLPAEYRRVKSSKLPSLPAFASSIARRTDCSERGTISSAIIDASATPTRATPPSAMMIQMRA